MTEIASTRIETGITGTWRSASAASRRLSPDYTRRFKSTATAAVRPIAHGCSSVRNASVATAHTISGGMAATVNGIRTETGIVILAATATTMTETATPA